MHRYKKTTTKNVPVFYVRTAMMRTSVLAFRLFPAGRPKQQRAAADIRGNHSRTPRNSKSTRILWNLPRVRAQSHATKRYLSVELPQVTRVERIGPVLFCAECRLCRNQSQLGHQPARTSDKMADCAKLFGSKMARRVTCIKSQNHLEYKPPCII